MAYIFTTNLSNINGTTMWFELKKLLVTAGWTVRASGDGLSAYSSSGDVFNSGGGSASGANNWLNNNAWFRIQMPNINGITREFTFQRTNTTNTNMKYSQSSGFTTGGNATTVPTAGDETSNNAMTTTGTDNAFHAHICADNASPYGFYVIAYINNAYGPSLGDLGGFIFDPIVSGTGPPSDPDPYILMMANASGSAWLSGDITSDALNNKCWFNKGMPDQIFIGAGGCQVVASVIMFPNAAGVNPYSKFDEIGPILWARTTTTSVIGLKGIGSLAKWNGITKAAGSLLTVSTTRDRICIDDINLPWDGSIPAY